METFEAELAKATNLNNGDLLGAIAIVIDNNVERGILMLDEPISRHLPEIEKCLLVKEMDEEIQPRSPIRGVMLRHLLLGTSGMGTPDSYQERFGSEDRVPPPDFPHDAHPSARNQFTHLFFEPGEGFEYGWGIYCYVDHHIFGALGMTASTYRPALVPHVWRRLLQMVERKVDTSKMDGKAYLMARDKDTYGLTCGVSDLARLFGDLMSSNCKLLQRQEHRDLFFTPQLTPGSRAHQSLLAETTNHGFLLPLEQDMSHKISWALTPPPAMNWTAAGALVEEDGTLLGSGIPKGTVAFEGQPNIIWTMNREEGHMMLCLTQLLPGYDVKAHNLAVQFLYDAWKTFG
ncbi:uncharacterized protein Triagg1_8153 [Trichoderma aggressivum f. europaeum]|uniref:Beta-lactamase-related domain-containing protein n=1 Tax=Trichoderma aggressivum f. europaeum TaxID=173218 RepID=A0AAE1IAI7_9HYPO|nr:hypothetical protein Triagg1_8153 [Trichoderma aggressivum f. europaeum]